MNTTDAVSVASAPPSETVIVGAIEGAEDVAVRLVTLVLAVELVKETVEPVAGPVSQAAEVPVVNDPPFRFPKTLVAVRLLMV